MTTDPPKQRSDVAGTYIFDGQRSRQGLPLNNLSIALNNASARARFLAEPDEFMDRFGLTDDQKQAVRDRDFLKMIELGGNIYFIYKIGMVAGLTVPDIVASMTGQTTKEFKAMMKDGGRKPHG